MSQNESERVRMSNDPRVTRSYLGSLRMSQKESEWVRMCQNESEWVRMSQNVSDSVRMRQDKSNVVEIDQNELKLIKDCCVDFTR